MSDLEPFEDDGGLPEAVARVANLLNEMYDQPDKLSEMIYRIGLQLDRKCVQPLLN